MSRIRSIKPELLTDEKTAGLSHAAHRLFIGCILLADDYGRFRATPKLIDAAVFWAHADVDVVVLLAEVEAVGLVHTYEVRGQRYGVITSWAKHQRVDHPGKPLCPGPEEAPHPPGGTGSPGSGSTPTSGGGENGSRESREGLANGSEARHTAAPTDSRLTGTGTGTGTGIEDPDPPRARDPDRDGTEHRGAVVQLASAAKDRPRQAAPKSREEPPLPTSRWSVMTGPDHQRLFAAIRAEILGGFTWTIPPDPRGAADSFARGLTPAERADVEPTMRLALSKIRDRAKDWEDPRLAANPSFAFGAWRSKFTALREELHGKGPRRAGPASNGPRAPKDWPKARQLP